MKRQPLQPRPPMQTQELEDLLVKLRELDTDALKQVQGGICGSGGRCKCGQSY